MAPKTCTGCGRPVTKCVCSAPVLDDDYPMDEEDDNKNEEEEEDWGAGEVNNHGDDDWATPVD